MLTIQLERLAVADDAAVLDLGCGRGRHLHGLIAAHRAWGLGVDLDADDLAAADDGFAMVPQRGAWTFTQADARALPFADGAFDAVICSEVLEHIVDDEAVIGEIARVLRPGGRLAVSVPRAWPERICWRLAPEYPQEPGGHVRIYDAGDLRAKIEGRGFQFQGRHGAHALHSPYWWLKCLLWRRRDDHPAVRAYQRFLEWDLIRRPALTRGLERLLDPILGKSVALYFARTPDGAAA